MDKSSSEYQNVEQSIDDKQRQAYGMHYQSKTGNEMNEIKSYMESLEHENEVLSRETDRAVEKGDTKRYDELNQRYSNNIKVQEGISSELRTNGIQHDNTIAQQKIAKQNLDIDMRNKMAEKFKKQKARARHRMPKIRPTWKNISRAFARMNVKLWKNTIIAV